MERRRSGENGICSGWQAVPFQRHAIRGVQCAGYVPAVDGSGVAGSVLATVFGLYRRHWFLRRRLSSIWRELEEVLTMIEVAGLREVFSLFLMILLHLIKSVQC